MIHGDSVTVRGRGLRLYRDPGRTVWMMAYRLNGKLVRRSTGTSRKADARRIAVTLTETMAGADADVRCPHCGASLAPKGRA